LCIGFLALFCTWLDICYSEEWLLVKLTSVVFEISNLAGAGKSTTTAMLSVVLRSLGEEVSAIVGAQVPQVFLRIITLHSFMKVYLSLHKIFLGELSSNYEPL